ncbi:MAG: molybdopterin-dependent oxidoreductase [Chloroflexi bacterium]|nr:molybdopterin-dependent oxidoreductase [Chloroflexota bacterium]
MGTTSAEKVVYTTCRSHCNEACVLKLHIRDGVVSHIETDDGPEPQYLACLKGRAYRQRLYSPERLTSPLKRTGERGEGKFAEISWDEAFETVASEIKRINRAYGPAAIILMCSAGDIGWVHNGSLIERVLVGAGGYTGVLGTVSAEGAFFASMATYGTDSIRITGTRDNLLRSSMIILWGWNPAVTRGYGQPALHLLKARQAGTRIVTVDPRYTDSAATLSDQWVPIRPGTDTAMLIAMAYVIISGSLQDQGFIDRFTTGFASFRDYVLGKQDGIPKTPAWAEPITGVPAATIESLAREYATLKPAALMDGFAPGRTAYGEQFHRAVAVLSTITGNVGVAGGNAGCGSTGAYLPRIHLGPVVGSRMTGGENPVDRTRPREDAVFYKRKDRTSVIGGDFYTGGPSNTRLNRVQVADAILNGRNGGYPADYKMLYLVNLNYVNQYGNTNKIVQALKKLEFIVVQEQFMNATARYADIVFPNNTYMERNDITTGGVAPFYGFVNKAVDSVGGSKSHYEIAAGLAAKLGIKGFDGKTEEDWLKEIVAGTKDIPNYEAFRKQGSHKVPLPCPVVVFEDQIRDPLKNPFPNPSGKIQIYSQEIADMQHTLIPPIPKYIEPWEGRQDALTAKYPLQLLTTHFLRRAHTQYDNVPWLRELCAQAVTMNPADARSRGIKDGDRVKVFNDRGAVVLPASVTDRITPGVVDIPEGSWFAPDASGVDQGGCANVLTSDVISPAGAFCSSTALVQVEKT